MRPARHLVPALCCAVAVACAGEHARSQPTPTALSTGSTTPPATPVSPSVDPASDAAILGAARAYVQAETLVGQQASFAPYAAVTTPTCQCRANIQEFVRNLQSHGWHLTAVYHVISMTIRARNATNADVVLVTDVPTFSVIDTAGHSVSSQAAEHFTSELSLIREGGEWHVFHISPR